MKEKTDRFVAIDITRGFALLGIIYAHLGSRDNHLLYYIGNGVAPALFAILAGMSLTNFSQVQDRRLRSVIRGVFFIILGLTVALLPNNIYIILLQFGVLFLLSALFIKWRPKVLFFTAILLAIIGPVVSFFLRKTLPYNAPTNADWQSLATPIEFALDLFITGPYPVIFWLAYFLLGMSVQTQMLTSAVSKKYLSISIMVSLVTGIFAWAAIQSSQVKNAIMSSYDEPYAITYNAIRGGLQGVTPTTDIEWLAVYFPHSGTPVDLLLTSSLSMVIIFLTVKIYAFLSSRDSLIFLAEFMKLFFSVGSVALTAYVVHVLMNTAFFPPSENISRIDVHLVTVLLIGIIASLSQNKGPLEMLEKLFAQVIVNMVRKRNLRTHGE